MAEFFNPKIRMASRKLTPNRWDITALLGVFTVFVLLGTGARQMSAPYHLGESIPIYLSPAHLPAYALQTVLRMFIALFFSLLFTFTIGSLAAKNRHAQKIIIPLIDIFQSVPVMGFLAVTLAAFIDLFPGSLWGVQCAAIFAVFTSQVWNITLSFYQSLLTLPKELTEAGKMFHLSAWQKFWRIEVPFAMPGLLWNAMLSMSGSWFFVVACETVTVSHQTISLPGIGSYAALAIQNKNVPAIIYTILTMLAVILLYDQLLFRPLIQWSDRFRIEQTTTIQNKNSWIAALFRRTFLFKSIGIFLAVLSDKFINFSFFNFFNPAKISKSRHFLLLKKSGFNHIKFLIRLLGYVLLGFLCIYALKALGHFIFLSADLAEIQHVFLLAAFTALRVLIVLLISTLIWMPVGVWIGLRPRIAEIVQPTAQFLAAFPVNLLFPLFVLAIVHYHLNVNIWTTPLMFLGTQWYILFNVIAGASALPADLRQAADNFGIKGLLRWRRLILPGIFPYYITGAITAAGNAWNTSTVAEMVSWGNTTLRAQGLGAYIMEQSAQGNFSLLILGIGVMSLLVAAINRFVWRPLYQLAQRRYQMNY